MKNTTISYGKKVAVLLAAFNGEKFLRNQIESILKQKNVFVEIFISLDLSNDNSLLIINDLASKNRNINLLPYGEKYGSAGRNFFRLIKDVNFLDFDFVAFSDQDDFWCEEKLLSAINELKENNAQCFSSDVIAYWPSSNKKIIIKKSQKQRKYDHFFEAAGPGCTYVFKRNFLMKFKSHLIRNWHLYEQIHLHDWSIYSYARNHDFLWFISSNPNILYIQHRDNLVGVNYGFKAKIKRLSSIINGDWISQVILVYKATIKDENAFKLIEHLNTKSLIRFFLMQREFRRKSSEAIVLYSLLMFFCLKKDILNIFKNKIR